MPASADIRRPAVAGRFYAGERESLRAEVEDCFVSPLGPGALPAVGSGPRRVLGIVAPHAGYLYSGAAAAWAYAEAARDGRPEVVVILGLDHRGLGAPLALSPAAAWQTPLGELPVDAGLADALMRLDPEVALDARAHVLEHSIEVQLPFLQVVYGHVPILPIGIGAVRVESVLRLGAALAEATRGRDVLMVASSDFSHYISQAEATRLDARAMERIVALDPEGLVSTVREYGISMCGVLPVAAMLAAAVKQGALEGRRLHYHTSGDVTGDEEAVVGYGALVVYH
jgi:MEMO1 family protein